MKIRLYPLPELTCDCDNPQPAMHKDTLDDQGDVLYFVKCDHCGWGCGAEETTSEAKQAWKDYHADR